MRSVRAVLVDARSLIEDPENWTQNVFEDENGRICATKALLNSGAFIDSEPYRVLQEAMYPDPKDRHSVCDWNDSHDHHEVLAKFDEAIGSLGG